MILKAAKGSESGIKPNLVVLPVSSRLYQICSTIAYLSQEVFNSPYSVSHFPKYAETISYTPGHAYDVEKTPSESVKMLSSTAREAGVWLLGGVSQCLLC